MPLTSNSFFIWTPPHLEFILIYSCAKKSPCVKFHLSRKIFNVLRFILLFFSSKHNIWITYKVIRGLKEKVFPCAINFPLSSGESNLVARNFVHLFVLILTITLFSIILLVLKKEMLRYILYKIKPKLQTNQNVEILNTLYTLFPLHKLLQLGFNAKLFRETFHLPINYHLLNIELHNFFFKFYFN